MKLLALLMAVCIVGCGSYNKIVLEDGKIGAAIECSAWGMNACYNMAGEACPFGWKKRVDMMPSQGLYMIVECLEGPKGHQ